jgi:hypothetical protein
MVSLKTRAIPRGAPSENMNMKKCIPVFLFLAGILSAGAFEWTQVRANITGKVLSLLLRGSCDGACL